MLSPHVWARRSENNLFCQVKRSRAGTRRAIVDRVEQRMLLSASSYTLNTLATFTGSNGSEPDGALIRDSAGNLYGLASQSGPDVNSNGTVFEVAANTHSLSLLGNFDGDNGSTPLGNLVEDSLGDFFGTTQQGGSDQVAGTVFEVTAGTTMANAIVSFHQNDGFFPQAGLVMDGSGNLFGTTAGGGDNNAGLVFEVAAGSSSPTTLATFDGTNGSSPQATLLLDSGGNLFGTTATGGANNDGTVFEVAAGSNAITTLATFNDSNGARPVANLIMFGGDLYGTTASGGAKEAGTVFKLDPNTQQLSTLVSFNDTDGDGPYGGVIADSNGNLFGTTNAGGSSGDGVVFEIPTGATAPTTLATFTGSNGRNPFAGLLADANGNLYGTTNQGGSSDDGTVFELTPSSGGGGGTAGTASQLVFTQPPAGATAGGKLSSIIVHVEDSSRNTVTNNRSKVTLSLVGGSGVKLTGSANANVKNGQAVFSHLSVRTAGTYTLQASDGALTAADSTPFTINPAAGKKLKFSTEPPATVSSANTFSVQVEIVDQYGNVATNDDTAVTLALGSHPKGSSLSGVLSESATDGLADFGGLSLGAAGKYTLKAASGKLKANSSKFIVS